MYGPGIDIDSIVHFCGLEKIGLLEYGYKRTK